MHFVCHCSRFCHLVSLRLAACPLHLIEAYPIRISRAMFDEILSFLPLASLYQMRSINRATCRIIEYMDEFVNTYSEALLLLNKAPSPMIEIEEDLDLEAEAVLQKEQAAEEERRARARSRSRKRQEKKHDKFLRRPNGRYKAFPSLLTPRGIALDMSRLAPTKPQSQTTGFKTKKAADQKKQKK